MKKLFLLLIAIVAIVFVSSCKGEVSDDIGIVKEVKVNRDFRYKKFKVIVSLDVNGSLYNGYTLYTNHVYAVGDTIKIR